MEPAVEIRHLIKEFRLPGHKQPLRAVDDVSMTIAPGEVYGLIGPNGSGKSTTMKAVLGLVAPTSGVCRVFGSDSSQVDSRQDVGFLPENPYFYKHLTGAETLRFYGKLCGLHGARLNARIDELLELVDLTGARNRRLGGYSKGMLQRIGLAQALVQEPRLVILDEPTAGVDPIGSREIRDLILSLKSRGITIFLCSHLLEQVQEVCDRVGIIFRGRMVKEGPIDRLLEIGDQTELVIGHASPALLARLQEAVAAEPGAQLIRTGRPKTTLERLFLQETSERKDEPSR